MVSPGREKGGLQLSCSLWGESPVTSNSTGPRGRPAQREGERAGEGEGEGEGEGGREGGSLLKNHYRTFSRTELPLPQCVSY